MGGGSWTTSTYQARSAAKAAAGVSTFDHTDAIRSGKKSAGAHDLLDPKWRCGVDSPNAGKNIRECIISDEHPNPTPIAVVLDVTGSNISAATVVHSKLPELHGALQRKGYVDDPQILIAATGDANSDRVPVQVGQFESDNRLDEQIEAMYLEGNGGGQRRETYEILAYFLARHTYLEPLDKQGKKGYAFFIGDEMPYEMVKAGQVNKLLGLDAEGDKAADPMRLDENVSTETIFAELQEKYEVFFLFQKRGAYREEDVLPTWRKLLGERALVLDDPAAVAETIAMTLALVDGGMTIEDAVDDLSDVMDASAVKAAGKALAVVGKNAVATATASGNLPGLTETDAGTTRL